MWSGIINFARTRVGHIAWYHYIYKKLSWPGSQVSLNIQELELAMWSGIINSARTRVGHVAWYH